MKSQKALKEQLGKIEQEISKEILANDGVIAFTLASPSAAIKQEILNSTPDFYSTFPCFALKIVARQPQLRLNILMCGKERFLYIDGKIHKSTSRWRCSVDAEGGRNSAHCHSCESRNDMLFLE